MNLILNIQEALGAIKSNLLRTIFTVSIIAIGIFSLIGILTTVEGIKNSIQNNLSSIGSNVFEIQAKGAFDGHSFGKKPEKVYPPITLKEATEFVKRYKFEGFTSISTSASNVAVAKYRSLKTNPNIQVLGTDEHYLDCESLELEAGRNFSTFEIENGSNSAIIGYELYATLFDKKDALGKKFTVFGRKYQVVGVLKNKGSFFGGAGGGRSVVLPLKNVQQLPVQGKELVFNIKNFVKNPKKVTQEIQNASAVMKRVRMDESASEDSFEVKQSTAMLRSIDQIAGILQIGGVLISIITLFGASIGLVNIMMVSVTERTREIGIRKAIGATPFRIGMQFLIESVVICVIGGLLGIVLGAIVGNLISMSMGSPSFYFPVGWTIASVISCVVVGVFAGLFPSIKAAKLDPIESLRFE